MSSRLERLFASLSGSAQPAQHLSELTWLGVGGPADWVYSPASTEELQQFLAECPHDIPLRVLGAGSNTLARDGGVEGVVIRLSDGFNQVRQDGDDIIAGAGATDGDVARFAARNGRAGLSFMIGIPGTVGGGLRMNAGCYGSEFRDVLVSAQAIDRSGTVHEATAEQMQMSYRHSEAPADWIFTSARFATREGEPEALRAEMKQMIANRADAQPVGSRTGGSTFANPEGHKAWQVIDAAGCRGLRVGGAHLSEKHCNFLINDGEASASDLETLGEEIRARVKSHSGIELRWEIRRIGHHQQSSSQQAGDAS